CDLLVSTAVCGPRQALIPSALSPLSQAHEGLGPLEKKFGMCQMAIATAACGRIRQTFASLDSHRPSALEFQPQSRFRRIEVEQVLLRRSGQPVKVVLRFRSQTLS